MKKTMKRNVVLSAVMAIVLCVSLISGATFALFTSESKVDISVSSGKVSVTATIDESSVETKQLYETEYTAGADHMFEGEALFTESGLTLKKFVPGDAIKFNIVIANNSNVSVKWHTVITCTEDTGLFGGLVVTVDGVAFTDKTKVTEWAELAVGSEDMPVVVTVELPEAAGNLYQDKSCTLSYKVEAVQGNAEVVDPVFVNSSASLEGAALSSAFDDLGEDGKGTVMLMLTDDVRKTKIVEYQDVFENDLTDGQNLVLDLAGNTVYTTPKLFRVNSGATLTIKSSVPGGKLIVNNNVGGNRFGISVEEGGTLNIEDGVIIEVLAFEVSNPGAISCSGTVNMNGGEIIVHDTIAVWMWGSATGSAFNMNGGKISLAPDAEDVGGVGIAVVNMSSENTYELHLNAGSIVGKGVAYDVGWATQGGTVTQSDAFVIDATPVTTGD